eukprot:scaffold294292_cov36-Tisochrysis_lutea.AAC.3
MVSVSDYPRLVRPMEVMGGSRAWVNRSSECRANPHNKRGGSASSDRRLSACSQCLLARV